MITASINALGRADPSLLATASKPRASMDSPSRETVANAQPLLGAGETVAISPGASDQSRSALPTAGGAQSGGRSAEEVLNEKLRDLNAQLQQRSTQIQFTIDHDSGNVIVKVVEKESGEVVGQIPPEELINLSKALKDLRGLMLSKTS